MSKADFHDEEKKFVGAFSDDVLESIGWGLARHKIGLLFWLFCNLVGRSLLLTTSLLIGFWVDRSLGVPTHIFLKSFSNQEFAAILLGLTGLGFLLSAAYQVGFARVGVATAMEYHHETMYRLSRAPTLFFDKNPVGRIFSRFSSDFQNLTRSLGPMLAETVSSCLTLFLILVFTGVANAWFLPVVLVTSVINIFIYVINRPMLRNERRLTAALRSPSLSHFSETVQGYLSIRVFGKHSFFIERFNKLTRAYYLQKVREILASQSLEMQLRIVSGLSFLLAGTLGVLLRYLGLTTIGEIGVILTYVGTASGQIQRICHLMATLEDGLTGAERLDDYLRQPLEPAAQLPPAAMYPTPHPRSSGEDLWAVGDGGALLCLENFSIRYGEGPYVLKGINLQVQPGECLGIIGRTGVGKTSLFQAILQYYPFEGKVLIDGFTPGEESSRKRKTLSLLQWRQTLGLISQNPVIFRGDVRYNLIGDRRLDDSQLVDVLVKVGLGSWYQELPHGLNSFIEEGGKNLSSGQRQLLATSRCLLRESNIILMDEATSAVDPQSEERFNYAANVLLGRRTRLIIAHRLSTLKQCDRVLWLENGGVRSIGAPGEVLRDFRANGELS